jgi:hypothetical protein
MILLVLITQHFGCTSSYIDNKKLLIDYRSTYPTPSLEAQFASIQSKLSIDSLIDTSKFVVVSFRQSSSLVAKASIGNEFETQYLCGYIYDEKTRPHNSWKIYKYTNYRNRIYLGELSGLAYYLVDNKLFNIVKKRTDNVEEFVGLEYHVWINYNGVKISRDILVETLEEHSSDNNYASLLATLKSILFELEMKNTYNELER